MNIALFAIFSFTAMALLCKRCPYEEVNCLLDALASRSTQQLDSQPNLPAPIHYRGPERIRTTFPDPLMKIAATISICLLPLALSLHQNHLSCFYFFTHLQAIEINPARRAFRMPLHVMLARALLACKQCCHLLAREVKDFERDMLCLR